MTINRTCEIDGITVSLTIKLTDTEVRAAHDSYMHDLEAKAAALDLLSTPMSPFMQDVLAGDPLLRDDPIEADPSWVRAYIRDRFAADLALNEEEEPTND